MKAFVPVCLYSNGFFLIKEQVYKFLHYYSSYEEILFVIVDKLYGINLLIKDKLNNSDDVQKAYEKRGRDIYYLVENCIRNHTIKKKSKTNYIIKYWNELAYTQEYISLKNSIISEFNSNINLKRISNRFIENNLVRMTDSVNAEKKRLEHDYLFSEIAMSIYLTEFCGYYDEIWEKKTNNPQEDPIGFLYRNEPESLIKIIGKKIGKRHQLYLSSFIT